MPEAVSLTDALELNGYCLMRGIYSAVEVDTAIRSLESVLHSERHDVSIRGREGTVYAARNVLQLWPEATTWWRREPLVEFLVETLGADCGLVRILYFDKPPEQTWSLPWHKDLTIAVEPPNMLPAGRPKGSWTKLTRKAGVPHVEADEAVLSQMLTLRIHLDPADEENGALWVIPGSHHTGKTLGLTAGERTRIDAAAGDVLLMRPLLAHSSGRSAEASNRHRRILHLEFNGVRELPHGFRWREYLNFA